MCCGVINITATGQNNTPHLDGKILLLIIELDGVCRAEFLACPAFSLLKEDTVFRVNGIFEWDGLGIFYVGGLALGQSGFIFVYDLFRALFRTHAAGDTFVRIHITRVLGELDFKIPLFSGYTLNFCKSEQLDVDVPADLDQFRRDNSHRAIISRECLVQL